MKKNNECLTFLQLVYRETRISHLLNPAYGGCRRRENKYKHNRGIIPRPNNRRHFSIDYVKVEEE
jgi:hypothetical protein